MSIEKREVAKLEPEAGTDERRSIYDILEEEITSLGISDAEKVKRLSKLLQMRNKRVNVLLAGATGAGKSSTVNALFNMEVAKVGVGVDPETATITKYELDNLILWDTPGLGDDVKTDKKIKKDIVKKLNEASDDGSPLIDLVIVILDASSKDLGTSYDLINNVLIPVLGAEAEKRILVALNQSDVAMKGNHWDAENNKPDEVLQKHLEEKAASVRKRIAEATGLKPSPVYFCAGYKEDGQPQRAPYNLTKLLYHIVKATPKDKRLAFIDNLNDEEENWAYDDRKKDYRKETFKSFFQSVGSSIRECSQNGGNIGDMILGVPGKLVGRIMGGGYGAVRGFFGSLFGKRYDKACA